jgi:hypothetical protein
MGDETDFERDSRNLMERSCLLFIEARNRAINSFKDGHLNKSMEWLEFAATIAYRFHPGFFADGECERLLWAIGKSDLQCSLKDIPTIVSCNNQADKTNVIHVMTTAMATGGHTRVVARWIKNCTMANVPYVQSIIITNQKDRSIPSWLESAAAETGGICKVLPRSLSPLERSALLRKTLYSSADLVVLHIHPQDSISGVALAEDKRKFPVLFFNHSDHTFLLGTSVADIMLEYRAIGREISEKERASKGRVVSLPIPLADPVGSSPIGNERNIRRSSGRERLGIPTGALVILVISEQMKLKPIFGLDFKRAANSILEHLDATQMYAIGVPDVGEWRQLARKTKGRFRPLGRVEDAKTLANLYWAADIYLVGIPLGSPTAMLDAGLYELPIHRLVNPIAPMTSGDDMSLEQSLPSSKTEEGYVDSAVRLLRLSSDERNRIGKETRSRILEDHHGESWVNKWLKPAIEVATANKDRQAPIHRSLPGSIDCKHGQPEILTNHYSALAMSLADHTECMILASLDSCSDLSFATRLACLRWSLSRHEPLESPGALRYFLPQFLNLILPKS